MTQDDFVEAIQRKAARTDFAIQSLEATTAATTNVTEVLSECKTAACVKLSDQLKGIINEYLDAEE